MNTLRAQRLALGAIVFALSALALASIRLPRLADDRDRLVLALLAQATPDARCGEVLGQWSALIGDEVPEDHSACFAALGTSPYRRALLERLVREPTRSPRTRALAFSALVGSGGAPDALTLDLLLAPATPPDLRLAVFAARMAAPDGARWADVAQDVPAHGLRARGRLWLLAAGEPGLDGAAPALRAAVPNGVLQDALLARFGLTEADLRQPLRRARLEEGDAGRVEAAPCAADCLDALVAIAHARHRAAGGDDPAPAPPLPVADARVEDAAADGAAADMLRAELHRLAAWIALSPSAERGRRLRALVLHPAGRWPPGPVGPDAPLAALAAGAGPPGAAALLAVELGALAGVPVEVRRVEDGVAVGVEGAWRRVGPCEASPLVPSLAAQGEEIGPEMAIELAVVEAVGAALRAGDLDGAAERARALPERPGPWAHARFVALAAAGLLAPGSAPGDVGAPSGEARYAPWAPYIPPSPPRRGRRGRAAPAAVNPPVVPAAAPPAAAPAGTETPTDAAPPLAAARLPELEPTPELVSLAAWWAARHGRIEPARALLAALPAEGLAPDVAARAAAVAAWLGEPGAAAPPTRPGSSRCVAFDLAPAEGDVLPRR